jgi:hypothetical protein
VRLALRELELTSTACLRPQFARWSVLVSGFLRAVRTASGASTQTDCEDRRSLLVCRHLYVVWRRACD